MAQVTINRLGVLRTQQKWELKLDRRLPLYGHRNWIVIADAAYPAQSNPGIETIVAGAPHLQVLATVLDRVAGYRHVRATIYLDREMDFVEDKDAPGFGEYRRQLQSSLEGSIFQQLPHEEIIAKLDQCAQLFRVLLIKTDSMLPYTSVFLELDCGYWDADAEERLRKAIPK